MTGRYLAHPNTMRGTHPAAGIIGECPPAGNNHMPYIHARMMPAGMTLKETSGLLKTDSSDMNSIEQKSWPGRVDSLTLRSACAGHDPLRWIVIA